MFSDDFMYILFDGIDRAMFWGLAVFVIFSLDDYIRTILARSKSRENVEPSRSLRS